MCVCVCVCLCVCVCVCVFIYIYISVFLSELVLTGSLSHGGDVKVYVFDINQPSLPTPFYFVLVSVSVFMALSTVLHSINSLGNSPLSQSVLLVLFLPYLSNYISLYESLPQP